MSNQEQARLLFRRLCEQLHDYELYDEVRTEVMDMSNYLDTDSIRRQANTVLRLTVVTIFGLIGTIVTSCTIVKSTRLADFIDALSDDRLAWNEKWGVWERIRFTRDHATSRPASRDGRTTASQVLRRTLMSA